MTEFEQMKMLLNGGGMRLGIAIRPMNSPGSPVYHAVENVWPPALVLGGSLLATWAVHYYLGFAVLAVGCFWWLTMYQPRISRDVHDRTAALVLNDIGAFDVLWRKGVLSLIATLPDGTQQVATRREDWREFIRHFAGEN